MIFGKHINRYYLKYAWLFLLGLLALVTVDYAQLEIPKIYRALLFGVNTGFIDEAKTTPFDLSALVNKICAPMLIIILAMAVGRFLWRVCFFGAGLRTEADVRRRMFDHAKDLSQQYYQVNKVGNLMSLFTNDLSTVEECFGWGVMMFFDALILGLMAIYNMLAVQPILALFCAIPLVFMLIAGIVVNKYLMKKWDARQEAYSAISDFAQESFSGISVIKAFVKEAKELWAFKKLNKQNEDANVEFTKLYTLLHVSVVIFVESVICIILGYGGYLVYNKVIAAEQLLEFIGYFTAIVWPVMAISELIDMRSRGKSSLRRIAELLDAEIDVKDAEGAVDAGELSGRIEFRNLTFRYPLAEYDALKNLSFTIEAGENVGIVGRIGSGKTTVVDLILRTYNVPDGTIFLDGKDVNTLTIESVRRNAAYVPQDNFLFSDTIENNIAFASDNATRDRVKRAAFLAGVSGNIEEFKEGYDTVLGERGVTVSGGQKQRISIARALMKEAPILILDDSVSAVDTSTEKEILAHLSETRKGKTTILIAHRISTIERMDKILFLEEGSLLAFGRHEELIAACPEYARAVELQKLEERGAE
ncbi:MAG: ABC transporter ATP-binding protein [Clostridia bacterium]|nr:ABC transporter ATP-binding protein [Clostridia bacterium]